MDRALPSGGRSRGFESLPARCSLAARIADSRSSPTPTCRAAAGRCPKPAWSGWRRRRDPARRRLHGGRGARVPAGLGPPVHAVRGNVDSRDAAGAAAADADRRGRRRADRDDPRRRARRRAAGRMRRRFPDADAVVFGHSHMPLHETEADGFTIFNPGSPTERRRAPRHTMGVATVADGRRRVRAGRAGLTSGSPMDLSLFFAGTAGSVPTARRGLPALLLRAGGDRHPLRLRRGHPAPAAALGRAAGPRRRLHHPLPRRPLARPARDAQDVRPARARAAADDLRPARPRGAVRDAAAGVRAHRLPADAGRARAARGGRASTATSIGAFPVKHRVEAYGYAFVEDDRPGRFDAEAARRLGVPEGPDFGRLQRGETVGGVTPEQVVGRDRARAAGS